MMHLRRIPPFACWILICFGLGCSAAPQNNNLGGGGSGGQVSGGGHGGMGTGGQGGNTGGDNLGAMGGQGGFEQCVQFTAQATQAPAAMLFAVDMSASMNVASKWGVAQTSIVSAMDKDVFDSMSLGLVTFPTSFTAPPQCICDYIEGILGPGTCGATFPNGVSCGFSTTPEVAIAPAGSLKSSDSMGVRHDIAQYLTSHNPQSNDDDGSPVYDALVSGYTALKDQDIERRILVLISDGGFSCTSLSPRDGYVDGYGCHDWEFPDAVNSLITAARTDPDKPIFTFVVGVPGSNSVGIKVNGFDTPPYHMKLALSTYAVSGSPNTVDPGCSKDLPFTKDGGDPPVSCHIDLSGGAAFNPDTLANAIQTIKGQALGCVYDLPPPPQGQTIDPDYVNVQTSVDGVDAVVPKRADPMDSCEADGCWDYNASGQVEILGKACADLTKAASAKVHIQVGCATIVK